MTNDLQAEEPIPKGSYFNWGVAGVVACVVFSLVFDKVWFQWISWDLLHIPMGLGGLMYPMYFLFPLILLSLAYQAIAQFNLFSSQASIRQRIIYTYLVPFALIAFFLIEGCPTDTGASYVSEFIKAMGW